MIEELPPVIDEAFGTNKIQSIAAISMTTSTWAGRNAIKVVTGVRGGIDVPNMWGPFDGPGSIANDPVGNAEKLRGTELYITNGSGLPGPHETLDSPGMPESLTQENSLGSNISSN